MFLGDRQPEQAHILHLAHDVVRDRVVRLDLGLERAQPLGDEAANRVDQCIEGFGVERHRASPRGVDSAMQQSDGARKPEIRKRD
jgi:hypothetical protein